MQIELIQLTLDDHTAYKYRPLQYCCCNMWTNLSDSEKGILSFAPLIPAATDSSDSSDETPKIYIPKVQEKGLNGEEIRYCPFCGKKIEITIDKNFDLSKSYRNLFRLKKRAIKREKFLQESHDMAEYATRLLDCFSCFEEIQNYSEQISSLHAESVQLYKLWKQLNEDSPYKEHISDVLRANKIFLHYMKMLNKNL